MLRVELVTGMVFELRRPILVLDIRIVPVGSTVYDAIRSVLRTLLNGRIVTVLLPVRSTATFCPGRNPAWRVVVGDTYVRLRL